MREDQDALKALCTLRLRRLPSLVQGRRILPDILQILPNALSRPERAAFKEMRMRQQVKERRRFERRAINRVAQFHSGPGALPRTCMITDISDTGARLYCDTEMPDTFLLAVSGEGIDARKECRVVWRLGGELGVRFIGRNG